MENSYSVISMTRAILQQQIFPDFIVSPELHPGIGDAAYAFDPDGHCLEPTCAMEQVGWDGKPRPKELRRKVNPNNWPDRLEPLSDTYTGEPFTALGLKFKIQE